MGFLSKLFGKKEAVVRQSKDPRITHVDIPKGMSIEELNATLYRAKLEEEADNFLRDTDADIVKVMSELLEKYDEKLNLNVFDVYMNQAIKRIAKGINMPKEQVVEMFTNRLNQEMIDLIKTSIYAAKAQGKIEDYNSFRLWMFMQERLK